LTVAPACVAGDEQDDSKYQALVKQAAGGDLSIDFRDLRLSCAKASSCDPRGDSKDVAAMHRAAQEKHYDVAVKIGQKLIAKGFANIDAHAICARAYGELKQPEKSKFHQAVTSALIRSILSTGDGKTKETAFEVIGPHEEHIMMSVLGLPPFGTQSLISGKPHSYDVIEVENPKTGQKVAVYFNIDAFFPMKGL
jgi:hypothetical protein